MLNGIPPVLSPELLKTICEMGHGDELVLADGNFPSASNAKRLLRADGHGVPPVLQALVRFFPLDSGARRPVAMMAVDPGDAEPAIKKNYLKILKGISGFPGAFAMLPREDFYARARNAYAIVATSETALYANIILRKGCVAL